MEVAHDSGPCAGNGLGVQIFSGAPLLFGSVYVVLSLFIIQQLKNKLKYSIIITGGDKMALVARNAYKGYTYQEYVHLFFTALMDTERKIAEIEAETISEHNFDDLYILFNDQTKYFVQIKNYPQIKLSDIAVSDDEITIGTNKSRFANNAINIVIINTGLITETDATVFGLPCVQKENVYIIPLTSEKIEGILNDMYADNNRQNIITAFLKNRITNAEFTLKIRELPPLNRLSIDLDDTTVLLRNVVDEINVGVQFVVGKPGVGKSHYVNELIHKFSNSIIYRFWINSQDSQKQDRLNYKTFLKDLAIAVFDSSKSFSEEELIEEIIKQDKIIIIDGLDHIENYNCRELQKYFDFFEKINQAKVVILTRPLKHKINYPVSEITDWTFDETYEYLSQLYKNFSYEDINNIYQISGGYPIITHFLAEHFQLHNNISFVSGINSINEFYDQLISSVDTKTALGFFAINDSYWQIDEIKTVVGNNIISNLILEFINQYPYLFNKIANRVSLIHDSLNTYLKNSVELSIWNDVIVNIKDSLLNNNINYMSRFVSFNFDEGFIKQIIVKYSDIDLFDTISCSNFDYFSIQEFYAQLKSILQYLPNTLTPYQYYSFVLINLITERYDIKYDYELLYNILYYANTNEKNIFSTGSFWKAYLMYTYDYPITFETYLDENYKTNCYQEMSISKDSSSGFFEILKSTEINTDINTVFKGEESELEKIDLLTNYLVRIMILNNTSCRFYSIVKEYLQTESSDSVYKIICMCEKYDIRPFLSKGILPRIKYILMELGFVRENNIFLEYDLKSLITEKSNLDSYSLNNYIVSFLRLANYEGRTVDINSLSLYYRMHYAHKDYSVENLGRILCLFEEKKLIKEELSEELVIRTVKQSERGGKYLYLEYCNSKPLSYIKEKINKQEPHKIECLDVFKLTPDRINELSNEFILFRLNEMLEYHRYGQIIEYNEIENVIISKYANLVLNLISQYKYSVKDVPSDFVSLFTDVNIINVKQDKEPKKTKSIIDQGYILEENIGMIDPDSYDCVELASYADGWYCCFPYPEIFSNYKKSIITDNALSIIHSALYAKIPKIHKIGNWWLCPFTILEFFDLYNIDVDWNKLYSNYEKFMEISLITKK